MSASKFLSEADKAILVKEIESAELRTSGEIRVHIESNCSSDPVARAVAVFNTLKMYRTKDRNAVLIYVAYHSRKLAIIGDSGINAVVPDGFWDDVKEVLIKHFASNEITDGIKQAIYMTGTKLKEYFPYQTDDINEQSNEISIGE
ncbi:MAG: TPM domain-containing protein [Bacteroidales bacterium]|nr:TPM domain-containing protein [Bacteroidales bacterium]